MNDLTELDGFLSKTIEYLIQNWYQENTGIVACGIKDDEKFAFATSTKNGKNWLHAEQNAYTNFRKLHGDPIKKATFVITLSPCIKNLKYRAEAPCVELIKKSGIRRIHFGVLDTLHAPSLTAYEAMGFISSVTQQHKLAIVCTNLMNLFATYDARINNELLTIKKSLGDSFFDILKEEELEKTHAYLTHRV